MLRSTSSTLARQASSALQSAARQTLPRAKAASQAVGQRAGAASASRTSARGLATTPSGPSTSSASGRRRFLPLAGGAALLLAGGAYFYSTREEPAVLAPDRWTAVKITSVTPLTPETSLFRLEVPRALLPPVLESDPTARPILSLFVKEPNLQIQRAYTPLSASSFNSFGPAELDLVIKRYPDGETSRYLHRLGPGDEMIVRGPAVTWYYRPQDWDEVVFVVGGTGISPAYQLLADSFSSPSPSTPALSIVYASPSPSRILLKSQLDALSSQPARDVKVQYLVDRLDPETGKKGLPQDGVVGMLDRKKLEKAIGRGGAQGKRRIIVVCGPDPMVNAVAGPRGRNFSQGPVGGMLKELGYKEGEVVKL